MRLVILAKSGLVHKGGGTEVALGHLCAGFSARGHPVVVVTTRHPARVREERQDGVSVLYLDEAPSGRYSGAWWRESVEAIRRLHAASRIDRIVSMSLGGYGYARWGKPDLGIPMVSRMTGDYVSILRNEWACRSTAGEVAAFVSKTLPEWAVRYWRWHRWVLRASDRIVAVSEETARALGRQFRVPRAKFAVVHNGTDAALFRPDAERRRAYRDKLGVSGDAPVLLMVSVLTRQKGVHLGVEAFRSLLGRLPDSCLVVVGDGPELPRLRASVRDGGLEPRVRFLGAIPNQDLAGYYNAADLLVFPTVRVEGFPWVLAEAMASGLPVVAGARGGVPSVVSHGVTGLLVNPGDAPAIARACLEVLDTPGLAGMMAAAARGRAVAELNRDVMIDRFLDVVSGAGPGARA